MNFDAAFGASATIAKQFEARWFFDTQFNSSSSQLDGTDDNCVETYQVSVHKMPFQRRNLSYWVGVQYGSTLKRKKQPHLDSLKVTHDESATGFKPKLDILSDVWKHRVRSYNDAFLSSPRRNTRNYAKKRGDDSALSLQQNNAINGQEKQSSSVRRSLYGGKTPPSNAQPEKDKMQPKRSKQSISNDFNGINLDIPEMNEGKQNEMTISSDMLSMNINKGVHNIKDSNTLKTMDSSHVISDSDAIADRITLSTVTPISICTENMRDLINWEKPASENTESHAIDSVNLNAKVFFHLLYVHQERDVCFQTDAGLENYPGQRRCIFCFFDGGTDVGLLMHCVTCHGNNLLFKAARNEDGTLHIAVSRKKSSDCHDDSKRDFVYVRGPVENTGCIPLVPFVKRSPSKTGALDSQTRRKKMRLVMELGADEKTRLQFVANSDNPIRQYFHSRSNEPMLPGEWDIDSDDEEDERWLIKMSDELIEEFDDVLPQEKHFAKLWNRFMKSHCVIADHMVPSKCLEFVKINSKDLMQHDLRQHLLLHLMGFWDHGLISSSHLLNVMIEYDRINEEHCMKS